MTFSFELLLQIAALCGVAFCVGAYIVGFIIKPKGNRRMHTASLLCSGLALGNVAVLLSIDFSTPGLIALTNITLFLMLSAVFQSVSALRGRSGDRRGERRADVVEGAPASA